MVWRGRSGAATMVLGGTVLVLLCAAPAPAAVVSVEQIGQPGFVQQQFTLRLAAAPGEPNAFAVTPAGTTADSATYSIRDLSTSPTPGDGCTAVAPGEVQCTMGRSRGPSGCNRLFICTDAGARVVLDVALGDGDDSVDLSAVPASDGGGGPLGTSVDGGDGTDTITGSPAADEVEPGPGGDTAMTGAGTDRVVARSGGPDGPDRLDLGSGPFDTLSYRLAPDGVTISVDGNADDGAPSEGDNVTGAERVEGGAGDDLIVGADLPVSPNSLFVQLLNGLGGEDRIIGGAGPDSIQGGSLAEPGEDDSIDAGGGDDFVQGAGGDDGLVGGAGDDNVDGGPGADLIRGSSGDDALSGEAGDDNVAGESGDDVVGGGAGRDTIRGGDGIDRLFGDGAGDVLRSAFDGAADRLDCGRGSDRTVADRRDREHNCER